MPAVYLAPEWVHLRSLRMVAPPSTHGSHTMESAGEAQRMAGGLYIVWFPVINADSLFFFCIPFLVQYWSSRRWRMETWATRFWRSLISAWLGNGTEPPRWVQLGRMPGWPLKSFVPPCFPKAATCGGKVQRWTVSIPQMYFHCTDASGLGALV